MNSGYEWTSVAYQETQAEQLHNCHFIMALLVAFLVLAAQYESWTSPVSAVMGLQYCYGAMLGCYVMGTPVSISTSNRYNPVGGAIRQERHPDCRIRT